MMQGHSTARTGLEAGLKMHSSRILETMGDKDGLLLDIGCGIGEYINNIVQMNEKKYWGVGIDIDSASISERRLNHADFVLATADYLPFRPNLFNTVFMVESLEHFKDQAKALSEASKVVSKLGYIYISVPNRFYPLESHGIKVGRWISEDVLPLGVPFFPYLPRRLFSKAIRARTYTRKEICHVLSNTGWVVTNILVAMPPIDRMMRVGVKRAMRGLMAQLERVPWINQLGSSIVLVARRKISI